MEPSSGFRPPPLSHSACCRRRGISAGQASGGISRDCSRCNSLKELQRAVRKDLSSLPGGGDDRRHVRVGSESRSRSRSKSPTAAKKKKTKSEKKKDRDAAAAKKKADAAAATTDKRHLQQCRDFQAQRCHRGDICIFAHGSSTGFRKIDGKRGSAPYPASPDKRRSRSRSRSRRSRSRSRDRGRDRKSRSRDRRGRSRSRGRRVRSSKSRPRRSRSKSPNGALQLTNAAQQPQTNFKKTISAWNGWIIANWKPDPPTATCKDCCFFAHFGKCSKNADGTKAKGPKDSCPVCRGGSRKNAPLQHGRYLHHRELRAFIEDNPDIGDDLKGWTKTDIDHCWM